MEPKIAKNDVEIIRFNEQYEKVKSRFYFFLASPPVTGGDLVYLQHIRLLREVGVDARIMYLPNESFGAILQDFPDDIPINMLNENLKLTPIDLVIVGESQGPFYRDMRHWMDDFYSDRPKFIVFNQAVHWTAYSFKSAQDFNQFRFAGLFCASQYIMQYMQDTLKMDLDTVFKVKKVIAPATIIPETILALPDSSARMQQKRKPKCKVSFIYNNRKRPRETGSLPFLFLSMYPEYADKVEFVKIHNSKHYDTLKTMRESDIFIVSGFMDSHNLPAVEAMVCGCHVLGYTGLTMEMPYFNDTNGWWFKEEGQLRKHVHLLKQAIDLYYATEPEQVALRLSLLENGKRTASELFSANSPNTQVVEAYREVWETVVQPDYDLDAVFAWHETGRFQSA
ncbi:glycosyltransferase family protein [Psittacicella hinzii]|uniref:Uncharacterized protein n=1 Tax=Psittacicella hinzii TaxID=2028575 RepID=A0A3A1YR78_9GAMM|nr:hypothetical protein [Psittacicella hinzii]RIY40155.1 hypothetical protein CKF58_01070 [Psittacicella hinzii]